MRKFKSLDRTARTDSSDTTLATLHQNTITDIQVLKGEKSGASSVSTCGSDSYLILWNFKDLPEPIMDEVLSHPHTAWMAEPRTQSLEQSIAELKLT
ncbi:hypothetical protein FHG87_016972 [Trinorchestia longiramus]|nr:hypothetical protein FHG87_016972 [Trinorchestia longiramus]